MILRPWHIDDIASLVKYANNTNIAKWLAYTFPHTFTTANADGLLVLQMVKMLIITLEP